MVNSSQKDKALPVKTSKPNFVTFFVYFGNSLLDYLWNFFVCYGSKPGSHFARNLKREFGAEELEVDQWIAMAIHWLSSHVLVCTKNVYTWRNKINLIVNFLS